MHDSLRGQFLVAGSPLRDPNFFRSVVLMVEHNDDGAMGLVVNRPSTVSVARALAGHFELPETDDLVFVGGPVEPAALFIVHDAADIEAETPVVEDLYVGGSAEAFERVVASLNSDANDLRFRIFCGCAGWGPGQLEGELDRGDWMILPASPEFVLAADPYGIWDDLVARSRNSGTILPAPQGDPRWN